MRLISYGCSYTFGEGLKDCWIPEGSIIDGRRGPAPGPRPSNYAWPKYLSNMMRCDLLNLGKGGCSNKFIWHSIMNTEFQPDDFVVILWTYFPRNCFFEHEKKWKRVIPADTENKFLTREHRRLAKYYYSMIHQDYDAVMENYLKINFSKNYLDSLGIRNYHFTLERNMKIPIPIPQWNQVQLELLKLNFDLPLAADNKHPGELAQKEMAHTIYDFIHK